MSNTPRLHRPPGGLRGVNGRPIATAPDEPPRPTGCPDGGTCTRSTVVAFGSPRCVDVDPPACHRVADADPVLDVFPGDTWPQTIVDDPAPVVNIDGVLVPPAFADHNRLEWKALTIDGAQGPIATTATTGKGWYVCSCGWRSGPLDPENLGRRLPIDQGEAWEAWAHHLPAGFLAFREALVQWRDDHPGLTMPPIGWDGVDRYAWRSWGTPRIDDAGKIVVPRRPDDPPTP